MVSYFIVHLSRQNGTDMKIKNGSIEINFECSGNKNGPVVVMAHSLGCNLHMWDVQMPMLEPDYYVIRLDMRGHGQSDVPPGPYTLEELADDVIAVMDSQNIDKAHWVGLSVGGMIGQSLLLRYPQRFISAVLADSASFQPEAAGPIWDARIKAVRTNGLSSIVDATMERWFTAAGLASNSSDVSAVRAQLEATSDDGYVACCHAIMKLNYIDQLPEIQVPVALIVGAEDIATPVAGSEAMHAKLPNSQLAILDNASHISNVEQVEAFNNVLLPFLKSVS